MLWLCGFAWVPDVANKQWKKHNNSFELVRVIFKHKFTNVLVHSSLSLSLYLCVCAHSCVIFLTVQASFLILPPNYKFCEYRGNLCCFEIWRAACRFVMSQVKRRERQYEPHWQRKNMTLLSKYHNHFGLQFTPTWSCQMMNQGFRRGGVIF